MRNDDPNNTNKDATKQPALDPGFEVAISYDASKQSLFSYLVANIVLLAFVGLFYLIPITLLVCLYQLLVNGSIVAASVLALLVVSSYYPSTILWQGLIDSYPWKTLCEYFSFTVIKPKGEYSPKECFMFVGKLVLPSKPTQTLINQFLFSLFTIFFFSLFLFFYFYVPSEFPHGIFPIGYPSSLSIRNTRYSLICSISIATCSVQLSPKSVYQGFECEHSPP